MYTVILLFMVMPQNLKQKLFLFFGIFIAGILGVVTSYSRYVKMTVSKEDSLFGATVYADVPVGGDPVVCECGGCACGGCSGGCFPAGTPVATPEGTISIEVIKPGDIVHSFDTVTGETSAHTVSQVFAHTWEEVGKESPLLVITHEQGVLTITANHQVYLKNTSFSDMFPDFAQAKFLRVGDTLTLEDGTLSKIISITNGPQYDRVYNLEVKDTHTYIAGGVRVHNDK
jgi:hypothetical protein